MPLYEYQCQQCKSISEKIQKFSDRPLTRCEKCGGKLERLLSSPAIQFKGSGWYITDYARKSGGDGKSSEPAKTSSSESKDGKSSEASKASTPKTETSKPSPATK
ncbi:MAG TPA: FmdB family zinc ribbon protein [Terriglobia bacterium]|nr:FmdB family zinc ribbon protein [Terriglobia bacterium]